MKRKNICSMLSISCIVLCWYGIACAQEYQPIAMWKMESIAANKIADSSTSITGLNNSLNINPTATPPVITTGYSGNGLYFNGVVGQNRCISAIQWNGYETIKFEGWVKPERIEDFEGNEQTIFHINNTILINCRGSRFYMGVTPTSGNIVWIETSATYPSGAWYNLLVTLDKQGNMLLQVNNETVTGNVGQAGWRNSFATEYMYIGANRFNLANFQGVIDEVTVSAVKYVDSSYYHINDNATAAIYRMEGITSATVLGETRNIIADDKTGYPERNGYPLVLGKRPDMGYAGMEPTLTEESAGKIGKALNFDGFDDMVWFERWKGSDYLKFEAWVKPYDFATANFSTRFPMLFELSSRARIWYRSDCIRMVVRKPDNSGWTSEYKITVPEGMWDHITAEIKPDGTFSLTSLYGKISGTTGMGSWLHSEVMYVVMGNDRANVNTAGWYFKGQIDDVKISDVMMPCNGLDYPIGDLTQDCSVYIDDLALFMQNWLKCTTPDNPDCINLN